MTRTCRKSGLEKISAKLPNPTHSLIWGLSRDVRVRLSQPSRTSGMPWKITRYAAAGARNRYGVSALPRGLRRRVACAFTAISVLCPAPRRSAAGHLFRALLRCGEGRLDILLTGQDGEHLLDDDLADVGG